MRAVSIRHIALAVAFVSAIAATSGCQGSLYSLPDPPKEEERRNAGATPAEEAQIARQRYLEARASLLELYNLLSTQRYREAVGLLSQETRDFLSYGTESGDPVDALAAGKMKLPSGRTIEMNPASLLVASDVSTIVDRVDGIEEHETPRRKELFAVQPEGGHRKIVMIKEGDAWVLHKTSIPTTENGKQE